MATTHDPNTCIHGCCSSSTIPLPLHHPSIQSCRRRLRLRLPSLLIMSTDADDDFLCSMNSEDEDDRYLSDTDADADEDNFDDSSPYSHLEKPHWSLSTVITRESLLAAQNEDIRKVMELFALREQHAKMLFSHYRWNIERIFELLEQKGKEKLFLEAGVTVVERKGCAFSSSPDLAICNIYFEEVPVGGMTEMDCGHHYCNDYWMKHFVIKIKDGQSRRIRCMTLKCNAICDEAIARSLVSARHPDIANSFDRFLLESYIYDNNSVKWCPSVPHCGNAIRVKGDVYSEVACACGVQFCFNCLSEAHSPCSCQMWQL